MKRVASELAAVGSEVHDLSVPGWVASKENIKKVADELKDLGLAGDDCVVVDLWSNSTYLGSDENGYPIRPTKSATDGRYHVVGDLQVAHKGVFQRIYLDCMPIFDSVNQAQVIVVLPFPRYIAGKCCSNDDHMTNFGTADYLDEIGKSADLVKAATAGLVSLGKNKVFSLPDMLANTDPHRTAAEILEDPSSWADPVHLARVHYAAVAGALLNIKAEADAEASPPKRARLESVVASQPMPSRGGKRIQLPGWILGKGTAPRGGGNSSRVWRGGNGSARGGGGMAGWPRGPYGNASRPGSSWGFVRGRGRGRGRGRN